jgi:hypothetical protein
MNKFLLTIFICCLSTFTVFGQDSLHTSTDDSFKARSRNFVTELNVNPFRGDLSLNNALNQLKLRYFTNDRIALRLGFSANTVKNSNNASSPYGTSPFTNNEEKKATTVSLNAGMEKHFTGTKRLSPYLGAEVLLAKKWSTHDISNMHMSTNVEGAWRQQTYTNDPNYPVLVSGFSERAFFKYGANIVTGFDFYMAKHFYFGYEIAFGFSSTQYTDINTSTIYTSPGTVPSESPVIDYDDQSFSFGPSLVNGIRLGYAF